MSSQKRRKKEKRSPLFVDILQYVMQDVYREFLWIYWGRIDTYIRLMNYIYITYTYLQQSSFMKQNGWKIRSERSEISMMLQRIREQSLTMRKWVFDTFFNQIKASPAQGFIFHFLVTFENKQEKETKLHSKMWLNIILFRKIWSCFLLILSYL